MFLICNYFLLWNTSGFLLPKNNLCKFWMKFVQRFWKTDMKILYLHTFIPIGSRLFAKVSRLFALIRESYALICAITRKKYFFLYENELNGLS